MVERILDPDVEFMPDTLEPFGGCLEYRVSDAMDVDEMLGDPAAGHGSG